MATVKPLSCGIDVGSTNVKVLLIDDRAETVWSKSIPVPRDRQPGGPVTDAAALVATLEKLIVEGWRASGSGVPMRAIACTGVGEDGVAVDAGLVPLDHSMPWFDRRAVDEASAIRASLGDDVRAGVAIDFSRTAAKWSWLRRHKPQVLDSAHTWLALTDYASAWWSRTPFMTETLAARTGCYGVFARQWLPGHLQAAAAPALPPVVAPGTIVGTVLGGTLVESGAASTATLLVAGGHDHPVAASAVRRLDPHAVVDSLGTANLMYGESVDVDPRSDRYVAFSVPALGGPGLACLGVFEFSASLQPLSARDGGRSLRAYLASADAPGTPGTAKAIAHALARAINASGHAPSDADDIDIRVALEANCFYARRMLESIRSAGAEGEHVFAVGGWARSNALMQIRASVLGQPLTTIHEDELTALGAALMAQEASLDAGRLPLNRKTLVIQPRADWRDAYERMYPLIRTQLDG